MYLAKSERARRAQSQQNMRARQQNREPRARGLALKKGLVICPFGAAAPLTTSHPHTLIWGKRVPLTI